MRDVLVVRTDTARTSKRGPPGYRELAQTLIAYPRDSMKFPPCPHHRAKWLQCTSVANYAEF